MSSDKVLKVRVICVMYLFRFVVAVVLLLPCHTQSLWIDRYLCFGGLLEGERGGGEGGER